MNDCVFYIIFPRGDRDKLDILEYYPSDYRLNSYALASRRIFTDEDECITYAKELAKLHNIEYVGKDSAFDNNKYLD